MPSTPAMQKASAIALHSPGKLFKRNRGLLKMAKGDLNDFASTSVKGLPKRMSLGKMMG